MSELNVRSDAVDVEQIMRQIRTRIREKRGADYTEAELHQLATVKLEKFLDPKGLRSDLVTEFRRTRVVPPAPPNYEFGETTLYETHRGPLGAFRRLLRPVLKLLFNPDRITAALHIQAQVNTQGEQRLRRLEEREPLTFELLHNLTLEVTRLGIEVHNLKMRVESLSSRVDFDERRAKALESVVQYRTPAPRPTPPPPPDTRPAVYTPPDPDRTAPASAATAPAQPRATGEAGQATGDANDRRRRRRRRRRRPGGTMAEGQGQTWAAGAAGQPNDAGAGGDAESDGDDGPDSTDAGDQ